MSRSHRVGRRCFSAIDQSALRHCCYAVLWLLGCVLPPQTSAPTAPGAAPAQGAQAAPLERVAQHKQTWAGAEQASYQSSPRWVF